MRTQEEILAKIKEIEGNDFFGFEKSDYIDFLDYEHAKPFLKDTATPESWKKERQEDVKKLMRDYLPFAFEKALGRRGISASRSISYFKAWLWIAGVEGLIEDDYEDYGLENLRNIARYLNVDYSKYYDQYDKGYGCYNLPGDQS